MNVRFWVAVSIVLCFAADALASPLVMKLSFAVTDMAGHSISSIGVGQTFELVAIGQDLTNPPPPPQQQGVFSAFIDSTYDSSKALIEPSAVLTTIAPFAKIHGGDYHTPGQISRIGVITGSFLGPGNFAEPMWSVPVTAVGAGTIVFTPQFDPVSGDDDLVFSSHAPLSADQIEFVPASLTITPEPGGLALACAAVAAWLAEHSARRVRRARHRNKTEPLNWR